MRQSSNREIKLYTQGLNHVTISHPEIRPGVAIKTTLTTCNPLATITKMKEEVG